MASGNHLWQPQFVKSLMIDNAHCYVKPSHLHLWPGRLCKRSSDGFANNNGRSNFSHGTTDYHGWWVISTVLWLPSLLLAVFFLKTMQSYSALFNVTYRKYCFCSSVFKFNTPKIYHNKKWSLTKIMSDSGSESPNLTAMLTVCLTIQIKDWYWLDMEIFESIKMIWLLRAVEMAVPLSWGDNSLCQILVTISPVPTLLSSLL